MVFGTISGSEWNRALTWDGFGYYYYLPMVFIQKTISLESLDIANEIFAKYNPSSTLYQFTTLPDGRNIIRYSSGQAVLYLPFFLIGHLIATLTEYPADGFSKPYNVSVLFGGLIYHVIGIALIGRILLRFYADKIVAVTLIVLFFGTNIYSLLNGMALSSHGTALFLIAGFIAIVDSYYRRKSISKMFIAGCMFGLICINRPTDFITIIPAILWPMTLSGTTVKQELNKIFTDVRHLLAFLIPTLIFAFLQFGYWKYAAGSWLINSYGNPGEGLDFLNPHTLPFLFSFKSGWLLYTPLMGLVLIYLLISVIQRDAKMQIVFIYILAFIYLASSWTTWWYGGGFSQRAMVQAYVLLSLPLAGLVAYAFFARRKFSVILGVLIPALVVLSFWQSRQYKNGVITADTVTVKYYFASFFDSKMDPDKKPLLAFNRHDVYTQPNYGLPDGYELVTSLELEIEPKNQSLSGKEFSPGFKIPYKDLCDTDHCFVRFTGVFSGLPPKSAGFVNTFDHKGNYGYQLRNVVENIVDTNKTQNVYTASSVYLTPHVRSKQDIFSAYIWNIEQEPGILKELKLEVYIEAKTD